MACNCKKSVRPFGVGANQNLDAVIRGDKPANQDTGDKK